MSLNIKALACRMPNTEIWISCSLLNIKTNMSNFIKTSPAQKGWQSGPVLPLFQLKTGVSTVKKPFPMRSEEGRSSKQLGFMDVAWDQEWRGWGNKGYYSSLDRKFMYEYENPFLVLFRRVWKAFKNCIRKLNYIPKKIGDSFAVEFSQFQPWFVSLVQQEE